MLYCGSYYIKKMDDGKLKYIKIGFVVTILVIQAILLFNFDVNQITDAYVINDAAKMFAHGVKDKIGTENLYFMLMSNNNITVLIQAGMYKVLELFCNPYNSNLPLEILDTVCIDLSIFLSYKLVKKFKDERAAILLLFVSMINPFTYLLIMWSYTLVYSLPIGVGIIYLGVLIANEKSIVKIIIYSVLIGITTVLGYFIRPTAVISFIALLGFFVVRFKIKNIDVKRYSIISVSCIVSMAICFISLKSLDKAFFEKSNRQFPMTHWVMMGLSGEGKITPDAVRYTNSFETTEDMKKANITQIKYSLEKMGVSGMFDHFIKKVETTWSDGSGNIRWYYMPNTKSTDLWQWLCGNKTDYVIFYCQGFRIAIVLLMLYSLIKQLLKKKDDDYIWLCELVVLGGLLFYMIWESKEIYCLPFFWFVHIIVADIVYTSNVHNKIFFKHKVIDFLRASSIGVLIFTLVMGIAQYATITSDSYDYYRFAIYTEMNGFFLYKDDVDKLIKTKKPIKQYFYVHSDFNYIQVNCSPIINNLKGHYAISLFDGDKLIKSEIVSIVDVDNGIISIQVPQQTIKKEKKYLLKILPVTSKGKDSISWIYRKSLVSDQYKGQGFYGDKKVNDLNIRVGNKYQGVYLIWYKYIIGLVLLLVIEGFMTYVLWSDDFEKVDLEG